MLNQRYLLEICLGATDLKFNEDLSVSVVVPFYNRSRFLKRLLDSIAAQTLAADKIYIIDNGSNLEETLKAWQIITTHKLVDKCMFTSSIGKGNANFARNLGYELAKTKYVAFLDSDDWWNKNHLKQSLYHLKNSNKAGVYSGAIIHRNSGQTIKPSIDIDQLSNPFSLIMSNQGYIAQTSSYVINKDKLKQSVSWSEKLKRHQDFDYFAQIYYKSAGWCYSPQTNVNIDWKNGGLNKSYVDFPSLILYYKKWNHLFPEDIRAYYLINTIYLAYSANADPYIKQFYHNELNKHNIIKDIKGKIAFSAPVIMAKLKTGKLKSRAALILDEIGIKQEVKYTLRFFMFKKDTL